MGQKWHWGLNQHRSGECKLKLWKQVSHLFLLFSPPSSLKPVSGKAKGHIRWPALPPTGRNPEAATLKAQPEFSPQTCRKHLRLGHHITALFFPLQPTFQMNTFYNIKVPKVLFPLCFHISENKISWNISSVSLTDRFIFLCDAWKSILQLMSSCTWRNMAIFILHISEVWPDERDTVFLSVKGLLSPFFP